MKRISTWPPLFLLPVFLSFPFVLEPLGRDQGYFAYGGWRILSGELPYATFWANTFPGIFWWYAFLELITGGGKIPVALGNGVLIGATAVVLSKIIGRRAGRIAACAYGIGAVLLHRFWDMGQAEQLLNLLLVLSVWCADRKRAVWAGLLLGGAILTKPIGVLFLPFIWRKGACRPLFCGLSSAALIFLLPYFLVGGVKSVVNDLIIFNVGYGGTRWDVSLGVRFVRALGQWLVGIYPAIVLGIVAVVFGWRKSRALVLWLVLALGAVGLQGKLFSYHWIPVLLPVCGLFGMGAVRVLEAHRRIQVVVILFLLFPAVLQPSMISRTWFPALHEISIGLKRIAGRLTESEYLVQFGDKSAGSDFSALEQHHAAAALRSLPGRSLLVWGFEPGINYLCKKPCPLKYVVDFPLTFLGRGPVAKELRARNRNDFLAGFQERPPDVLVIVSGDSNPVEPVDSEAQLRQFPRLWEIVETDYSSIERIGGYQILLRKE